MIKNYKNSFIVFYNGEDGYQGVSKLSTEFERLAGISIYDETGQLKDTYDILKEMSVVMPTLSENTQQYLLELAAGKDQITTLQSLLTNWEGVENAVNAASKSAGSATAENEKYLQSLEGLSVELQSQLQELSSNIISDEAIRWFYEMGIAMADFANSGVGKATGEIILMTTAVLGFNKALNSVKIANFVKNSNSINYALAFIEVYSKSAVFGLRDLATGALTLGGVFKGLSATIMASPLLQIALVAGGIYAVTKAFDHFNVTTEEAIENINNLTKEYEDIVSELDTVSDKIVENNKLISEATAIGGNSAYIQTLQLENIELQRQKDLLEGNAKIKAQEASEVAVDTLQRKDYEIITADTTHGIVDERIVEDVTGIEYAEHAIDSFLEKSEALPSNIADVIADLNTQRDALTEIGSGEVNEGLYNQITEILDGYIEITQMQGSLSTPDLAPSVPVSASVEDYINQLTTLKEAQDTVADSAVLSYEQMKEITTNNPELADSIVRVADGWKLSESAITQYSDAFVAEQQRILASEIATIQAEIALIEQTKNALKGDELELFLSEQQGALDLLKSTLEDLVIKEDVFAGGIFGEATEETEDYTEALSDLESQYEAIKTAQEEFNETGNISIDTYETLLNLSPSMLSALIDENGQIKLNEQAWQNALKAQAEYTALSRISEVYDKISGMQTEEEAINYLTGLMNESSGLVETQLKEMQNSLGYEFGKEDPISGRIIPAFNSELTNAFGDYMDNIMDFTDLVDFSTSSSSSSSSSSDDPWKDAFEAQYKQLQHALEMNEITELEYTDSLEKLYQAYFANRAKYLDDYMKYEEEVYANRKSIFDDMLSDEENRIGLLSNVEGTQNQQIEIYKDLQEKVHAQANYYRSLGLDEEHEYIQDLSNLWWDYKNAIDDIQQQLLQDIIDKENEKLEAQEQTIESAIDLLDKEIEKYDELNEAIQDQIDQLEEQADNTELVVGYATNLIDEQIDKLNEEKEALQAVNDEQDRAIELAELQQALENAKNQKTVRAYDETRGFYWTTDQEAIDEAQQALEDFEQETAELDIDNQIEQWEEQKEAWSDLVSNYEENQDKLLVEQLYGSELTQDILDQNSEAWANYIAEDYANTQEQIKNLEERLQANEEEIESLENIQGEWEGLADSYEQYNNELLLQQEFGAEAEKELLDGRLLEISNFANEYVTQLEKVKQAQAELDNIGTDNSETQSYEDLIKEQSEKYFQAKEVGDIAGMIAANNEANKIREQYGVDPEYIAENPAIKGFSSGGIANYTGLAQLHGTPSEPEYIFNHNQFGNLAKFFETLTSPNLGKTTGAEPTQQYNFNNLTIKANNPQEFFNGLKQYATIHGRG